MTEQEKKYEEFWEAVEKSDYENACKGFLLKFNDNLENHPEVEIHCQFPAAINFYPDEKKDYIVKKWFYKDRHFFTSIVRVWFDNIYYNGGVTIKVEHIIPKDSL